MNRNSRVFSIVPAGILTFLMLSACVIVQAEDRKETPTKQSDKNSETQKEAAPAKSDSEKSIDEDLLKKLLGNDKTAEQSEDDPLERAIRSMRKVEKSISQKETGEPTQELQKQIVSDLGKLIELAKRQKSSPNQQNPPKPKQQPQDQSGQAKPKDSQQSKSPKDQSQEKEDASDSSERTNQARKKEAELSRGRELIKDVWGHLPPTLREKMLNIYSEKTLPKYEDLVRRYYEALAESSRKKSSE